jgi:hypothetical protein
MSEYLDRLSDLEADLHNANARIVELEAKLAMVKNIIHKSTSFKVEFLNSRCYFDSTVYISRSMKPELDSILSDTRKPLAVEKGQVYQQDGASWLVTVQLQLMPDQDVDVIVLPKEVE